MLDSIPIRFSRTIKEESVGWGYMVGEDIHEDDRAGSLNEFIDGKVEAILEPSSWQDDRMAIFFASIGPLIWMIMALQSFDFAAIAIVCHAQVGFFLCLIALGYRRPRAFKGSLIGIAICAVLSSLSWIL